MVVVRLHRSPREDGHIVLLLTHLSPVSERHMKETIFTHLLIDSLVRLHGNQSIPDAIKGESRNSFDTRFSDYIFAVCEHRIEADIQSFRDLFVDISLHDKP